MHFRVAATGALGESRILLLVHGNLLFPSLANLNSGSFGFFAVSAAQVRHGNTQQECHQQLRTGRSISKSKIHRVTTATKQQPSHRTIPDVCVYRKKQHSYHHYKYMLLVVALWQQLLLPVAASSSSSWRLL